MRSAQLAVENYPCIPDPLASLAFLVSRGNIRSAKLSTPSYVVNHMPRTDGKDRCWRELRVPDINGGGGAVGLCNPLNYKAKSS
eukprot:3523044-Pleurochrysis_carterae.AAC.1